MKRNGCPPAELRRALEEYLRRRRRAAMSERYRGAYRETSGLGDEYQGWEDEGIWPPE